VADLDRILSSSPVPLWLRTTRLRRLHTLLPDWALKLTLR